MMDTYDSATYIINDMEEKLGEIRNEFDSSASNITMKQTIIDILKQIIKDKGTRGATTKNLLTELRMHNISERRIRDNGGIKVLKCEARLQLNKESIAKIEDNSK